jgi:hypothetical protein
MVQSCPSLSLLDDDAAERLRTSHDAPALPL